MLALKAALLAEEAPLPEVLDGDLAGLDATQVAGAMTLSPCCREEGLTDAASPRILVAESRRPIRRGGLERWTSRNGWRRYG